MCAFIVMLIKLGELFVCLMILECGEIKKIDQNDVYIRNIFVHFQFPATPAASFFIFLFDGMMEVFPSLSPLNQSE